MPKCDFNFIEIALRHGCSPVNVMHIFGTLLLTALGGCFYLFHILIIHGGSLSRYVIFYEECI